MTRVIKCDQCEGFESKIIRKIEKYSVKGEEIEARTNVRVCICGNELFDEELENENLKKFYDEYRKRHEILSPLEIKAIRNKYGLSQRSLGKILGWGEITIHRYESGALPNTSHERVLKLLDDPFVMKKLLLDAEGLIPKSTFSRSMEKINKCIQDKENINFLEMVENKVRAHSAGIESGFREFNLEKFINTVLFFAQEVPMLWKTKLNKLLFYADFKCFNEFTFSLTGLKYIKLDYGPVPNDYEGLLWSLESAGILVLKPDSIGDYYGTLIKPILEYDSDVFSEEEYAILNEVKNKYGNDSSTLISEKSHQEKAWKEKPFYEVISYEHALELNKFIKRA